MRRSTKRASMNLAFSVSLTAIQSYHCVYPSAAPSPPLRSTQCLLTRLHSRIKWIPLHFCFLLFVSLFLRPIDTVYIAIKYNTFNPDLNTFYMLFLLTLIHTQIHFFSSAFGLVIFALLSGDSVIA